jgi:hypothetical protein
MIASSGTTRGYIDGAPGLVPRRLGEPIADCATPSALIATVARRLDGSIMPTARSLLLRRPTEWSPPILGLDYGQHTPTGTTALVWVRGSGSRPQVAGDALQASRLSSLASPVVSYQGSKFDWVAST